MDTSSVRRRATAAYEWLRVSPLATITTLFIVFNLDIASLIFTGDGFQYSDEAMYVNLFFGIAVSSLWHLNLLRFANNPESEFVRKHGRLALTRAAVRTGVPLLALALDFTMDASGLTTCLAIALLVILWNGDTKNGIKEIEKELGKEFAEEQPAEYIERPYEEIPSTVLEPILWELRDEDPSVRMTGLRKLGDLNGINEAIHRELISIAQDDQNLYVKAEAARAVGTIRKATGNNFNKSNCGGKYVARSKPYP